MDNDEKTDLLLEVSEASDSEVSDNFIEDKVRHVLAKETHLRNKFAPGNLLLILSCFLLFISSTILVIILPVYMHVSSKSGINVYSKCFTLTCVTGFMFIILYSLIRWIKRFIKYSAIAMTYLSLCLPKVVKASSLLSIGSVLVFWLADQQYISCHLQDPLKGCVIVFSLLFYFIFSKRRTSVERVFCTITVIIGTFITVDFGLCNRYRCRGLDILDVSTEPLSWHVLYVVAYIIALASFALHLTCLENCCTSSKFSSILDMSIVPGEFRYADRLEAPLPVTATHSLSIISGQVSKDCPRPPLNVSTAPTAKYPVTSTPNEIEDNRRSNGISNWLALHHVTLWLLIALCFWIPTISWGIKKPRVISDVFGDVMASFVAHLSCFDLWLSSVLLMSSYLVFAGTSVYVLVTTRSALTVACVLMNALPMAQLFWSVFQLDTHAKDPVSFKFAVTGEAVSAMLGFPIIGIGTFLIVKSHVTQPSRDIGTT